MIARWKGPSRESADDNIHRRPALKLNAGLHRRIIYHSAAFTSTCPVAAPPPAWRGSSPHMGIGAFKVPDFCVSRRDLLHLKWPNPRKEGFCLRHSLSVFKRDAFKRTPPPPAHAPLHARRPPPLAMALVGIQSESATVMRCPAYGRTALS